AHVVQPLPLGGPLMSSVRCFATRMNMRLLTIAILILLPVRGLSQELNSAEKFRSTKEFQNVLSVFKETQIPSDASRDVTIYRVIIAPTFYHPLSIRIEKRGGEYSLTAKRLSGQGGYRWGTLQKEKRRKLREREWQTFLNLLGD